MRNRTTALRAAPAIAAMCIVGPATAAHASTTPLEILVFQGDLDPWIDTVGLTAVVNDFAQADILVLSHPADLDVGGSEWPNLAYGARGCGDFDNRASLIDVLDGVEALNPDVLVFGYVAGTADAPDVTTGSGTVTADCGNSVNNIIPSPTTTEFTACPQGMCLNFVRWVQEWITTSDDLHTYIDGIFIDYVSEQHMNATIRDNLYSYVKGLGLRVMMNSLVPGSPSLGYVPNYEFAADSAYLDDDDYVMVEGYYTGFPGPGNLATQTEELADVRDALALEHGERPRIAALVTQAFDTSPAIACTDADYVAARAIFDDSFVTGDSIAYQTNDLYTYAPRDANGAIIGAPYNANPHCA